jgi:hypothetical protein
MNIEKITKTPLGSKKFIFASVISLLWMCLICLAIVFEMPASVIESMVWAAGLISSLYLGGQSFVDSLVRATMVKYGNKKETL